MSKLMPCRDNRCMKDITVDEVFTEVCRAYDQQRATRPKTALQGMTVPH